jgi:hypothetical protein
MVLELSLADLHGTGHRLRDEACRRLIEDDQLFTGQPVGRRHARRRSL